MSSIKSSEKSYMKIPVPCFSWSLFFSCFFFMPLDQTYHKLQSSPLYFMGGILFVSTIDYYMSIFQFIYSQILGCPFFYGDQWWCVLPSIYTKTLIKYNNRFKWIYKAWRQPVANSFAYKKYRRVYVIT